MGSFKPLKSIWVWCLVRPTSPPKKCPATALSMNMRRRHVLNEEGKYSSKKREGENLTFQAKADVTPLSQKASSKSQYLVFLDNFYVFFC